MLNRFLPDLFPKKSGKFNRVDVLAFLTAIDMIAARANPSRLTEHDLILAITRLRLDEVCSINSSLDLTELCYRLSFFFAGVSVWVYRHIYRYTIHARYLSISTVGLVL